MNLIREAVSLLPFALALLIGWFAREWWRERRIRIGGWSWPTAATPSREAEAVPGPAASGGGAESGGARAADDVTWLARVDATSGYAGSASAAAGAGEPVDPAGLQFPPPAGEPAGYAALATEIRGLAASLDRQSEQLRPSPAYEALATEVRGLAASLERQSEQLQKLRTDFKQRLSEIQAAVVTFQRQDDRDAFTQRQGDRDAFTQRQDDRDAFMQRQGDRDASTQRTDGGGGGSSADAGNGWDSGVETYSIPMLDLGAGSAAQPSGGGVPVEVREGMVVVSHSLPPVAYAYPEGKRARVYLNQSVEINEYALPRWQAFFEMPGARAYATYRTVRAAEVSWDGERGSPDKPGLAEVV